MPSVALASTATYLSDEDAELVSTIVGRATRMPVADRMNWRAEYSAPCSRTGTVGILGRFASSASAHSNGPVPDLRMIKTHAIGWPAGGSDCGGWVLRAVPPSS